MTKLSEAFVQSHDTDITYPRNIFKQATAREQAENIAYNFLCRNKTELKDNGFKNPSAAMHVNKETKKICFSIYDKNNDNSKNNMPSSAIHLRPVEPMFL